MRNKLCYITWMLAAFFMMSCEDLEDTYSEYAGDGMIRYVGKCPYLDVQPGWNRARVAYKGNRDATVKEVRISYQSENDAKPIVITRVPRNVREDVELMDTVYLPNLQNSLYTVRVVNIDAEDKESMVEEAYVRPYTKEHEDLNTFTRGVINFYPMREQGRMVVILDEYNENLKEIELVYWGNDGEEHHWNILEYMQKQLMYTGTRDYMFLLPVDESHIIDFDKQLVLRRRGKLAECIDEIPFDDLPLELDEKIWSAGFTQLMIKNYGPNWESEVDNIKEVEFDYNITTIQDLFYLPALEKVILGKNRYMQQENFSKYPANLSITDNYKALLTLQYLKEVRGVENECYNRHYFLKDALGEGLYLYPYMLSMDEKIDEDLLKVKSENMSHMPSIELFDDMAEWKVTCSDTTRNGMKDYGAGWLLDDKSTTYFEPEGSFGAKVIEVKIDMKTPRVLNGFKVVQPALMNSADINYLFSSLKVEVSLDDYVWENATYEEDASAIGNTPEEISFIEIPEQKQKSVRYIRLTMSSRMTGQMEGKPVFSLRLGDVIPY